MRGVLWRRLLTSLGCCKRKNTAKGAIDPRLLLGFICGEERCGILKQSKAAVIIKFLKAYLCYHVQCYHVQTAIARGKVIIVDLTIVYVPYRFFGKELLCVIDKNRQNRLAWQEDIDNSVNGRYNKGNQ